jgi:hypothetical protein
MSENLITNHGRNVEAQGGKQPSFILGGEMHWEVLTIEQNH